MNAWRTGAGHRLSNIGSLGAKIYDTAPITVTPVALEALDPPI